MVRLLSYGQLFHDPLLDMSVADNKGNLQVMQAWGEKNASCEAMSQVTEA